MQSATTNHETPAIRASAGKHFDVVVAIFVTVLLVSQTIAQKIAVLGPLTISVGIILFPISYIFGDVLTEVYGFKAARRVIWLGFACATAMALTFWLAVYLPPAPGWTDQAAFEKILGFVPRIVAASLVAYVVGEFVNSIVLAKLKVLTQGRHLWLRTISSTVIGQAVDTLLVMTIAFAGVLPLDLWLKVAISIYASKVFYEVIATPLTYVVVGYLKRVEGVDVYDSNTRFNPFGLK